MANLKIIVGILFVFQTFHVACDEAFQDTYENKSIQAENLQPKPNNSTSQAAIIVGAAKFDEYLPLIKGKKVGLVINQTSTVNATHLVDTLLMQGIRIEKIFAPEHGFRGTADAGEKVANGRDSKTGLPIISLYGKRKKPLPQDLAGIEVIIFDIQDVGARFYTYISTMSLVMEACAEQGIPVIVLDRPNPNGHYVDGPILDSEFSSFVGMHPVPVVHGMTVGEYAQMVNGEAWLKDGIRCELEVIKCQNYHHQRSYDLPIAPSPNLPNANAIQWYPSLCFFEGTNVSIGRGTNKQFQIIGAPAFPMGDAEFTPRSMPGAKYPKFEGKLCKGYDFSTENFRANQLNLKWLLHFYEHYPNKASFFSKNNFFDKLAGTDQLRLQIQKGLSENEIRATWKEDLSQFIKMREKYLLYRE